MHDDRLLTEQRLEVNTLLLGGIQRFRLRLQLGLQSAQNLQIAV